MKLQQKQHKLTHNKLCGILFHLQLSLSLSLMLATGMGHSLALRLSLWGRSTRIYECANVYDNFAHKCKLLPQTHPSPHYSPFCTTRAWPTGTSWVAHPPQLCGKPSELGQSGSVTESKMRVHILHGIPHKHHVGSYSLSTHTLTHTHSLILIHKQSILYLKLQPHLLIAPAATVHCSMHCAHFTIFSSYTSTHTHTRTYTVQHRIVCPLWYLQCFIVAGIFFDIWVSSSNSFTCVCNAISTENTARNL